MNNQVNKIQLLALFFLFNFTVAFATNNTPNASNNKYSNKITITPTEVFFGANQDAAIIKIKNISKEKIYLETKLLKWEHNDTNNYTLSNDLLLSNQLIAIDANSERTIAVKRKTPSNKTEVADEQSYRLLLSELTISAVDKKDLQKLSMPIFIKPNQETDAPIQWSKKILKDNTVELSLYNPNNSHRVINEISLKDPLTKKLIQQQNASMYLLAKQRYTWNYKNPDTVITKNNAADLNNLTIVLNTTDHKTNTSIG